MCNKFIMLSLIYILVFVFASVQCEGDEITLQKLFGKDTDVGRTFGHNALKRLSFIFLPVMFTLGVISTLLLAIAVISVKNLAIGVILLIVGISQAVSRLLFATAPPPPLVLHPRTELLPAPPAIAAPWPPTGPLLSPWARSDDEATIPN